MVRDVGRRGAGVTIKRQHEADLCDDGIVLYVGCSGYINLYL